MAPKVRVVTIRRNVVDGVIVNKDYVRKHPNTTVVEHYKVPIKKNK